MYNDMLLWKYGLRLTSTERRIEHDIEQYGLRCLGDPKPFVDDRVRYCVVHTVEVDASALEQLNNILENVEQEERLRKKNPALKKAYDNYKLLLAMADQNVETD